VKHTVYEARHRAVLSSIMPLPDFQVQLFSSAPCLKQPQFVSLP